MGVEKVTRGTVILHIKSNSKKIVHKITSSGYLFSCDFKSVVVIIPCNDQRLNNAATEALSLVGKWGADRGEKKNHISVRH